MATHDLGEHGVKSSDSIPFAWRWHDHIPFWPVWCVLGLLLVGYKENRTWQAWVIFLPLAVVPILLQMMERLFSMAPGTAEVIRWPFLTLSLAWSGLWLLAPRFSGHRPGTVILVALGVAAGVAILAQYGHSGATVPAESIQMNVFYGAFACALVFGMALAARACRMKYSRRRFQFHLYLWIVLTLATIVGALVCLWLLTMLFARWFEFLHLLLMLVAGLGYALVLGSAVYLMNWPFLLVAFHCPTYRQRFADVFRLPEGRAELSEGLNPHDAA